MYTDEELLAHGLNPYHLGEHTDAVIVHTDHAQYRDLQPTDTPGARVVVDGRRILNNSWAAVTVRVLGTASN